MSEIRPLRLRSGSGNPGDRDLPHISSTSSPSPSNLPTENPMDTTAKPVDLLG